MAENLALAGFGQNDEFVRQVAANRAGIGPHRNGFQSHARKCVQIGHKHAVIGLAGAVFIQIKGIGILHQKLAAAHDPEARADFIAELPLDMVQVQRQILVASDVGPENIRNLLLIRGPIEHIAFMPVGDTQHFLAVIIIAARFPPEIGWLHGRHQDFKRPCPVLFLTHDLLDLFHHLEAHRQPAVDPGGRLPDHSGPQHQPVGGNLGLLRVFLEGRQKITGQTHLSLRTIEIDNFR